MAEYNNYNLQEDEVVVNTPLHSGGCILYGSELALGDDTTSTSFAFFPHPGSHPHISQTSMGRKKSASNTFKDGRLKQYAQPPNPDDPLKEKKRKKSMQSHNHREGTKLEFEVLQRTEMGLKSEIGTLEEERIRLMQNVQNLEMQQNWQYQACSNMFPTH
ncbi:hypothetical protein E2C01_082006 [Portunus trituberculatus]|uniref:Uncharacterized protein n=1 Tax=Portunus trituberculatus TaxID=210409 RepID=A0A5B7J3U1_PORTR|nr:hypothetical protein [Portunus trituberculatus]